VNGRRTPWLALGAAVAVASGAIAGATATLEMSQRRVDGAALYEGRQPLVARVSGHEQPLPALATRCANCHEGAQAIAPGLNERTLAQALPRRGGPPSRYDARALCRLLREGLDPALVLVPREMPRYAIDEPACAALWTYLSSR
jgi:hypothetical protein